LSIQVLQYHPNEHLEPKQHNPLFRFRLARRVATIVLMVAAVAVAVDMFIRLLTVLVAAAVAVVLGFQNFSLISRILALHIHFRLVLVDQVLMMAGIPYCLLAQWLSLPVVVKKVLMEQIPLKVLGEPVAQQLSPIFQELGMTVAQVQLVVIHQVLTLLVVTHQM
jgi:hypothetical protein